jgi:hypothetical protein
VTDTGVNELEKALPTCRIIRSPPPPHSSTNPKLIAGAVALLLAVGILGVLILRWVRIGRPHSDDVH